MALNKERIREQDVGMGLNNSFLDFLRLHEKLNEMFLCHQETLLSADVNCAIGILRLYETKLLNHMQEEEQLLLPIYEARTDRIPGGPVELFLGEHKKMRGFISEFHEALCRMRAEGGHRLRRSIIALMDRQFMHKHLVEHHDLREKNILYPWLDRITTEEERLALLKQCRGLEEMGEGNQAFFADRITYS